MIGSCRKPVWKGLKDSLKKDETERDTFVSYSNNCFSSIQIFMFQALHNSGDGHISNFMRQQRRGKEGKGRRDLRLASLLRFSSPPHSPFCASSAQAIELDIFKNCEGSQTNMPQKVRSIKKTDQQKGDTLNSAKLIALSES